MNNSDNATQPADEEERVRFEQGLQEREQTVDEVHEPQDPVEDVVEAGGNSSANRARPCKLNFGRFFTYDFPCCLSHDPSYPNDYLRVF